jgi:hypothetical protein
MSTLNSRTGWGTSFSSGEPTDDPTSKSAQNGRSGVSVWRPGQNQPPVSSVRYAGSEMKIEFGLGLQTSVHIVTTATVSLFILLLVTESDELRAGRSGRRIRARSLCARCKTRQTRRR